MSIHLSIFATVTYFSVHLTLSSMPICVEYEGSMTKQAGDVIIGKKENGCHLQNVGHINLIFHMYIPWTILCIFVQDMMFLWSNLWPGELSTDHNEDAGWYWMMLLNGNTWQTFHDWVHQHLCQMSQKANFLNLNWKNNIFSFVQHGRAKSFMKLFTFFLFIKMYTFEI